MNACQHELMNKCLHSKNAIFKDDFCHTWSFNLPTIRFNYLKMDNQEVILNTFLPLGIKSEFRQVKGTFLNEKCKNFMKYSNRTLLKVESY